MTRGVVSFCVGTGRCGTTFLARLAALEPEVAASHERLRRAATFHMFCKWHGIEVDPEGFLADRDAIVREDLAACSVSFESSALLSHSIAELAARYDARFVLLVRSPHDTVASFAARGWFLDPIPWQDADRPPTLPDAMEPRHFFGRNLPRGPELARWRDLTQIGKLAWFWRARNQAILEQLDALPENRRTVVRLEDLDHDAYVALAERLGWRATVSRADFDALAAERLNAGPNAPRSLTGWDARETDELEQECAGLAWALGYEPSTERRRAGHPAIASAGQPTVGEALDRLRYATLFPPGRRSRVWRLAHPEDGGVAELTWSEDELEVTLDERSERQRFSDPVDLREALEDWLDELAVAGFVPTEAPPGEPRPLRIRYSEVEARVRRELPSPGAWLLRDASHDTLRDALDEEDDEDPYLSWDAPESPLEEAPEWELRDAATLAVDEAFEEPIKESPFDLAPELLPDSEMEPPPREDPELAPYGDIHRV